MQGGENDDENFIEKFANGKIGCWSRAILGTLTLSLFFCLKGCENMNKSSNEISIIKSADKRIEYNPKNDKILLNNN